MKSIDIFGIAAIAFGVAAGVRWPVTTLVVSAIALSCVLSFLWGVGCGKRRSDG